MKYNYTLFFIICISIFSSCESSFFTNTYSERNNKIQGEFESNYGPLNQAPVIIDKYSRIESSSFFRKTSNDGYEANKTYQIFFETEQGTERSAYLTFKSDGKREDIYYNQETYTFEWRFKTDEEFLNFYLDNEDGFTDIELLYTNGRTRITNENVINRSKIVDTDNGFGIFVDIELRKGIGFGGSTTINEGEYYYQEEYTIKAKNFRVRFLVDLDEF